MAIFVYINKRKVTFFSARCSNFSHFSHQLEHPRSPFSFFLDVVRDWKKHFIFRCNIESYTDQVRIFHYSINMNIHIVFSGLPFWSAYFIYGFICISLSLFSQTLIDKINSYYRRNVFEELVIEFQH